MHNSIFIALFFAFFAGQASSQASLLATPKEQLDYGQTIAWEDDFKESFYFASTICVYMKCSPKCKIIALPCCGNKMSYTEPTVHVETTGEHMASYLRDDIASFLEDYSPALAGGADKAYRTRVNLTTGRSNPVGYSKSHAFYYSRVWGISPAARFDSSGGQMQVKKSMACDLADAWYTWSYLTTSFLPTSTIKLMMRTPGMIAGDLSNWETKWFNQNGANPLVNLAGNAVGGAAGSAIGGAINSQSTPEFSPVFIAEAYKQYWNLGVGSNMPKCQNNIVIDVLNNTLAPTTRTNPNCIGNWGMLDPHTGFVPSAGNNNNNHALVNWRAYDLARPTIWSEKIQKGSRLGNPVNEYWTTDFNMEWPHKTEKRYPIGTPQIDWAVDNPSYEEMPINELTSKRKSGQLTTGNRYMGGQISTYWKDTECKVDVGCYPHPLLDKKWRIISHDEWEVIVVNRLK